MPEVVCTLGFGEGVERFADLLLQTVDGARGGASYQGFEFGKRVFDRVQVRRVGWQVAELGAGFLENVTNAGDFVGGQIVHDHDVAVLERRRQAMTEIGEERDTIHGTIDYPGHVDAIDPKGGNESQRFPVAVGNRADQTFADRTATIEPRHLRGEASFIEEHQPIRVDPRLNAPPGLTPSPDVRTILFRGVRGLFLNGCGFAKEKYAGSSC